MAADDAEKGRLLDDVRDQPDGTYEIAERAVKKEGENERQGQGQEMEQVIEERRLQAGLKAVKGVDIILERESHRPSVGNRMKDGCQAQEDEGDEDQDPDGLTSRVCPTESRKLTFLKMK